MGVFYWKLRSARDGQACRFTGTCLTSGEVRRFIAAHLRLCLSHEANKHARVKRPVNALALAIVIIGADGKKTFCNIADNDDNYVLRSSAYVVARITPARRHALPPLLGVQYQPPSFIAKQVTAAPPQTDG